MSCVVCFEKVCKNKQVECDMCPQIVCIDCATQIDDVWMCSKAHCGAFHLQCPHCRKGNMRADYTGANVSKQQLVRIAISSLDRLESDFEHACEMINDLRVENSKLRD